MSVDLVVESTKAPKRIMFYNCSSTKLLYLAPSNSHHFSQCSIGTSSCTSKLNWFDFLFMLKEKLINPLNSEFKLQNAKGRVELVLNSSCFLNKKRWLWLRTWFRTSLQKRLSMFWWYFKLFKQVKFRSFSLSMIKKVELSVTLLI